MAYDIQQSTTQQKLLFLMVLASDHITGATGKTVTVTISKAGGTFATPSGAVTELANGWYQVAANATDTNTLGPILLHATEASCDPTDIVVANVVAYNPQDATALGLSRIDAAISSRMATFTLPTNFSAFAITAGGAVTAGTVSDKTGYSLTQTFPTNFSALAITAGGAVTAGTVSDKTGYALTQTFPANFSALGITVGGAVTAGTVSDKTGYELDATGSAALTEGYRANGAAGTIAQLLYEILAHLSEASISGTTKTVNKLDHVTAAATYTLDSSTTPTSIKRAT